MSAASAPHIFRISEITRALKDVVEGQFPFVWVQGQVSNLSRPASGHVYFSLKDEEALLNVVWFKGCQAGEQLNDLERYDPRTGEVLSGEGSAWLADGAEVLCAGRLSVYPPRGAYQMVAELVQDKGTGRLHQEFEALKARLHGQGLFDAARKRPLPPHPARVAVVTAPAGAAIRDFLRIAGTRGTGSEIRVYPALVQGEAAPGQIAARLDAISAEGWAEVAVVIRGGGSLEDLWAFNTEEVAWAIHRAPMPVVCGVGHEVDTTIADLAADMRAATPTHAAELLWVERSQLVQRVDEIEMRLRRIFAARLGAKRAALLELGRALTWLSPRERVIRLAERLEDVSGRLRAAWRSSENRMLSGLSLLDVKLASLDPKGPLRRGYALARKADGTFLRSVGDVRPGDALDILVSDGAIETHVSGPGRLHEK